MANEKIARATIVLYDGAEQPVAEEFDVLLEIRNNYGVNQSTWVKGRLFSSTCSSSMVRATITRSPFGLRDTAGPETSSMQILSFIRSSSSC